VNLTSSDLESLGEKVEPKNRRYIRLAMYFVFYGIFMELGLLIARYKRHDSSHDESHAGLMVMSFVVALAADVWYVLANLDNLFSGIWN
jgi:hypothetical protein